MVGIFCGAVAANYARPIQKNLEAYNAAYRKPWWRIPIYAFAFVCGYYGGIQLPSRFFPKFSRNNEGISHAVYSSSQDMVGKFRLFENIETLDTRSDIASYLAMNSTTPLTKNELMDHIGMRAL